MNLRQAGILGFYAGCAAGGAVAYFVTKRQLRGHYEKVADTEIAQAKEYYERKYKVKDPSALVEELHPDEAEVQHLKDAVEDLGYLKNTYPDQSTIENFEVPEVDRDVDTIHGRVVEETDEGYSVFEQKEFVWDWEHEKAWREQLQGLPYIIHTDEFHQNESGYDQVSLTYWGEDDVLAEAYGTGRESHIPDKDAIVGEENLDKFGHGANDPNTVYIRNDKLQMEYEITYNGGSYAEQVLGFEHEDRPKTRQLRRFRE